MSRLLYRFLDTNGDGTGETNAIGDYSSTAQIFKCVAQDDAEYTEVHRLIVSVEDSGAFDAGAYGNNIALTNGISVFHINSDGYRNEFTNSKPILKNADWAHYCYDVNLVGFGTGNDTLAVRWTFTKAGKPLILNKGEVFGVQLNDDFTGLEQHLFHIQGYIHT